jgi:hypothetical protein
MNPSAAMATGVSFVCAHCEKFWWGVDRKLDGCKAHHEKRKCGGPIKGLAFPEYVGPLNGHLQNFCFVSGQPSTAVFVGKHGSYIGVTDRSIAMINEYSVDGERPRFITKEDFELKRG